MLPDPSSAQTHFDRTAISETFIMAQLGLASTCTHGDEGIVLAPRKLREQTEIMEDAGERSSRRLLGGGCR